MANFCQFSLGKIGLRFVTENFITVFTARKENCHLELTLEHPRLTKCLCRHHAVSHRKVFPLRYVQLRTCCAWFNFTVAIPFTPLRRDTTVVRIAYRAVAVSLALADILAGCLRPRHCPSACTFEGINCPSLFFALHRL